jgi:hypothetical protein
MHSGNIRGSSYASSVVLWQFIDGYGRQANVKFSLTG